MNTVMTADFHGTTMYGSRVGDAVYVALKPIAEAIGLNWPGQEQRVKRDPVLQEGVCVIHIPSAGGPQEALGLKLSFLPGWLFKISALRIKSQEIRSRVILYQRECYDVLAKHFLGENEKTDQPSYKQTSLNVRMAREARLLFGKRAGAEVWFVQGLPHTPSMSEPPDQGDLFSWAKKKRNPPKKAA